MHSGMAKIDWDNIDKYEDSEISYFLFLEGKSIETISKIRNIESSVVQNHIIRGKIKYRFLVKSNNMNELLNSIVAAGKQDKLLFLHNLNKDNKSEMLKYIKDKYVDMHGKLKETSIWIIGELKDLNSSNILIKASVHNLVNVRRMAISAMGKINDEKFENALMRALSDENPQVVSYAIKALIKLKSRKSIFKITELKEKTDKDYIKNLCSEYLKIINGESGGM
ncbi:MAG: HEAT repeat domain-containing protein [Clostridium sp.]|nr:HEAT repeat domain-containing protein [Clostridium sp.]